MNAAIDAEDVERFRLVIEQCFGLRFDDARVGDLAEVLERRLQLTEQSINTYLDEIVSKRPPAEIAALANELTTPESYFFRNIDQFHAFVQRVLPECMKQRTDTKTLRILSAGCATGEEPYTVAIMLRDALPPDWRATVLGVDLNPVVLQKAKTGRYSAWSLRETPIPVQERWFTREGRDVVVTDQIKAAVTFEQRNLAEDDWHLWGFQLYDVIFCRNVMMYFTPENARALVRRITNALAPGGFLFLGHAETLRGITHDFHLCHTHRTFYYQVKSDSELVRPAPVPIAPAEAPPETSEVVTLASLAEESNSWVEAIQAASERVQLLVDGVRPKKDVTPEPPGRSASVAGPAGIGPTILFRPSLTAALTLLREEHFNEALALVDAIQANLADDPDVLLLQAVLLTHAGELPKAEEVCRRLVELDELSAPSHYILALCREGAGDLSGAIDQDKIAAYLDPTFAMPRLHLGLLARRVNDFATARAEFNHAVDLLKDEDASRLLLFGGGFGRDALIELCHAEMREREAVQ